MREISLGVTILHLDLLLRQNRGHRRIHVLIGASNLKSLLPHRGRNGRHRRAANADKVNRSNVRPHWPDDVVTEGAEKQEMKNPRSTPRRAIVVCVAGLKLCRQDDEAGGLSFLQGAWAA